MKNNHQKEILSKVPKAETERNETIYEEFIKGDKTAMEIAEEYGISRARVYELIHKVERNRQK